MPTECEPLRPILFPPQTWWLLNLFLVSFDKLPCLHWDIPLTQPLVIVYTTSRQSWHALSDFDSNIHFASEVAYRKWLDRSSLFLQLPPLPPPQCFHWHWHHSRSSSWQRVKEIEIKYISVRKWRGECDVDNFWKWTILIRPSPLSVWSSEYIGWRCHISTAEELLNLYRKSLERSNLIQKMHL